MRIFFLRVAFLLFFGVIASAQQSKIYTHELTQFNKAVQLFEEGQYYAAQVVFKEVKSKNTDKKTKGDCSYYIVSCALRLNQSNVEVLMEDYLDTYPESSNNNQMYLDAAFYFFDNANYGSSIKWFEKVDATNIGLDNRDRYNFDLGYSYYYIGKTDMAEEYLKKTVTSKKYGAKSNYYLGYMLYKKDDNKGAQSYLEKVVDDQEFQSKVNYLLADIYFNLKNFDKAIAYGLKQIDASQRLEKAELSKIIGESYFYQKKYKEAIPYLLGFDPKLKKWYSVDYYQIGYAYYSIKEYENAISYFNKIIEDKNAVTQNAYYHLGESYLKLDKKLEAFNAFKNASEMDFEPELQEDAYYNYAKLSYEIGNPYQSVPSVLRDFLQKYPKTKNKLEINKLIVSSLILSKDYKEALLMLENDKSIALPDVYQKAAYLLGMEMFLNKNYTESIINFDKSLIHTVDQNIAAKALFWKAESEYLLSEYKLAIVTYKQFIENEKAKTTPEYENVLYAIGYAYFKIKNYEQAIINFNNYVMGNPKDAAKLRDAYLRLGDSYYVTTQYWTAANAYNKIINAEEDQSDYAYFQKAMCYGYLKKLDQKIENLKSFKTTYPKSKYVDDALYELANAYSLDRQNPIALTVYEELITSQKNSVYVSKSLLRQALIYYNEDKDKEALAKLKKVVSDFPATPESLEAVATAKIIYIDMGKVNEYAVWVKTLKFIEVSDEELDNLTFESAEKQYLQNNTELAIEGLRGYIQKYPKGLHSTKANYQLAQLLYTEKKEQESVPYYLYITSLSSNEYTEVSLVNLSKILLRNKEYKKAIPHLVRIEKESQLSQNISYAVSNLMKSYYEEKMYLEAVQYAEKVINTKDAEAHAKNDSKIIMARSAFNTGNKAKAKEMYAKLIDSKGELGAEALYYEAYFKNADGDYSGSNASIQKLAKDFSGYKYFGAKGLLVMADNFYKQNDNFQATYVLETVIKNFQNFPDVVTDANKQLIAIKSAEEMKFLDAE